MIENISFRLWDIDKYIDFLKSKYSTISEIKYLPTYERLYNEYLLLSYQRNMRLIVKGCEFDSNKKRLTKSEQKHFDFLGKHIEKLKTAVYEVVILDWYKKQSFTKDDLRKKYFVFDKEGLENFDIDISSMYYLLNEFIKNSINDFILDVTNDFANSPLPEVEYYTNRIAEIKEIADFKVLDLVLAGKVIDNLDSYSQCMAVAIELIYIKQIQYLENLIYDLNNPKPLQTVDNEQFNVSNQLTQKQIVLLFQCLCEIGVISNEFNQIDQSLQARLIALMVGVDIDLNTRDWNFYKYWTSIRSTNDYKKVLTKSNIITLLNMAEKTAFSPLIGNLKSKLKDVI